MPAIDVRTDIVIARPLERVAAFSAEPSNAPRWYVNIKSVEWQTSPPMQLGSRVAFVATFLGRRLVYTYEIVELINNARLVMRATGGALAMETTYEWFAESPHATRMTLRNRGDPSGFATLLAPLVRLAVRKQNRKDLARLKALLEDAGTS